MHTELEIKNMNKKFPRTPFLAGADVEIKRNELLNYFHATFDRYESLFELLNCEDAFYKNLYESDLAFSKEIQVNFA